MKKIQWIYALMLMMAAGLTGCQSIEDTIKEYTEDGEIRYVGQCRNLAIQPGWERLYITWENSVDPIVDKIMLTWEVNDEADTVYLDRGTTAYNLTRLAEGNYRISVAGVDKEGNVAYPVVLYGRPYSDSHEAVLAFTRIISKHYFIGNRLVLTFGEWQDGVKSAVLKYTLQGGQADSLVLDQALVDKKYYLVPGAIDKSKPVRLYRSGMLAGSLDLITFAPYQLAEEHIYSSDFKEYVRQRYGLGSAQMTADGEIREDWVQGLTELELDGNFLSFEDVFYLPNLKKLVLGKHRYLTDAGIADADRGQSKVYDANLSDFALKTMNSLTGLTVDRYNKHYSGLTTASYIEEKGKPSLPTVNELSLAHAVIKVTPADANGYNSFVEALTDGNVSTIWRTEEQDADLTYKILIDLGEERQVNGLKLVQKSFTSTDQDIDILPSSVQISVAGEDRQYVTATNVFDYALGRSSGETHFIDFRAGLSPVRYVEVSVPASFVRKFYATAIAEIALY